MDSSIILMTIYW